MSTSAADFPENQTNQTIDNSLPRFKIKHFVIDHSSIFGLLKACSFESTLVRKIIENAQPIGIDE